MKKGITLIAVTMVIVLFTGCSIWSRATTEDESVFSAIILEFNSDSVTVSPVDGGDAVLRSHSQLTFDIGELGDIGASHGDIVSVSYTGGVRETYPVQIDARSWSMVMKSEPDHPEEIITLYVYNFGELIFYETVVLEQANLFNIITNIDALNVSSEDSENGKFIISIMDISYEPGVYWHCYVNGEFLHENISLYEAKNKDVIELRFEEVIIGRAADTQPAETVYFDDYDIYEFIGWHHAYDVIMDSDELKPEMDTLFAIYKTWILESMLLETIFNANESKGGFMIPVEMVKNTVSYLYGGIDGNAVQYDNFYVDENNPDYFWLPDGFSRNPDVFASIELDTLVIDNGVYRFDVVFTVLANDEPSFEEVSVFNYEFEQVLYKDEFACFRFLGAVRTG